MLLLLQLLLRLGMAGIGRRGLPLHRHGCRGRRCAMPRQVRVRVASSSRHPTLRIRRHRRRRRSRRRWVVRHAGWVGRGVRARTREPGGLRSGQTALRPVRRQGRSRGSNVAQSLERRGREESARWKAGASRDCGGDESGKGRVALSAKHVKRLVGVQHCRTSCRAAREIAQPSDGRNSEPHFVGPGLA